MFVLENQPGGDTQPNTESAPNNLSEAGRAFFDTLLSEEGQQPQMNASGQDEIDPNFVDIPLDTGSFAESNPPLTTTKPNLDMGSLEAIKNSIIEEIQSLRRTEQAPTQTETEPDQMQDEQINDDDFMEEFSMNPVKAVMDLANKIADQKVSSEIMRLGEKIQPLLDESEKISYQNKVKDTIGQFISNEDFKDASEFFPQMAQMIREKGLPQDNIDTYINTYRDVALQHARANRGKTLDEYLSDDNEIAKIVENPKIQDAIIERYLQSIHNGGKPQVITSGGNVTPVATPPTEIKTFEQAHKAFKSQI